MQIDISMKPLISSLDSWRKEVSAQSALILERDSTMKRENLLKDSLRIFHIKHVAVAYGLGKFGLNNLVINPMWGPRVRLATVITDAKFEYNRPLRENPCLTDECEECVKICPVHALDGWRGKYDPDRGWVIDKKKCYDYIFNTLRGQRCGMCIKACPVGLNKRSDF